MLEEVKRKEVDKRDKQLPQSFEQLIQMYDLEHIWTYIGNMTNYINNIYPIGSIYISTNDVNPATIFGGKWEQIKDTFLLSAGDTYQAGSTGGESTHQLTYNEMPSHTHSMRVSVNGSTGGGERIIFQSKGVTNDDADIGAGDTLGAGNGLAHNNMPPYLAVYVWKRIS